MNTTEYVSVPDTSIGKGQAAAIGLSAIFGFTILGGLCVVCRTRMRPADKEDITMRASSIVIRELKSRRPSSVVIREPVSRRPSIVSKSEV